MRRSTIHGIIAIVLCAVSWVLLISSAFIENTAAYICTILSYYGVVITGWAILIVAVVKRIRGD